MAFAGLGASFAPVAPAGTVTPCGPSQLSATMRVIPDSQGAGNIGYTLTLTNKGSSVCVTSGVPGLQLLDAKGRTLPTRVLAVPKHAAYPLIPIAPGAAAIARMRFSPDVAGTGDRQMGACQPVAHRLRVTLPSAGHGSLIVAISPPTSVCERGTLQVNPLRAA